MLPFQIINNIMEKAFNYSQFPMLLDEVDSMYSDLLLYNKVPWLSRGEEFKRFVVCLKEVHLGHTSVSSEKKRRLYSFLFLLPPSIYPT